APAGSDRGGAARAPASAARELPRGGGRAADDRGDLLEGQVEHVVQDEGEAFRRIEPLEYHEKGEPHGARELRFLLGIGGRPGRRGRLLGALLEGLLLPRFAGTQRVEADTRDPRLQPSAKIVDVLRV